MSLSDDIRALLSKGVSLSEIKQKGYSASAMKLLGYTASQLSAQGWSLGELTDAGYSLSQATSSGGTGTINADNIIDGTTNKAYTGTEQTKLSGIATGATANQTDVYLLARTNHTGTESADTITDGTTNKAYTATEKTKLAGIATAATANSTDAQLRDRSTHTGTQLAATVSDFQTTVTANTSVANSISHIANTSNPHSVTKAQVGLTNVDDTSDATKNAASVTLTNKTLTSPVINTPTGITKGDVGLGNVVNSDTTTTANITDSSNKRFVTDANLTTIGNQSGTNTGNETTTTIGALINGATSKTTPIDADYTGLMDSAASNVLKKLSWANVKATLKTYFDAIYTFELLAPSKSGGALKLLRVNATETGYELTTLTPGLGDVVGPVGATDNHVVVFNGATGLIVKDSGTPILGTPVSGNLANCTFPTLNQSTTGSAATLTTSRSINGIAFNGSADITVTAAAGTLTGNTLASGVTASSLTSFGASIALGTPASGTLTNCTFPTLNQNTTGSAGTVTGFSPTAGKTLSVVKTMTLTAADDTGSYTLPTGTKTLVATDVTTLSSLAITESQVTNLTTDLAAKQATLVSATNIKTVNGSTLLGSGDLVVTGSTPNLVPSLRVPTVDQSIADTGSLILIGYLSLTGTISVTWAGDSALYII